MSQTQVLLSRIAALRQHLEQVQGLANDAGAAAASLLKPAATEPSGVHRLQQLANEGMKQAVFLDTSLRQLAPDSPSKDAPSFPKQLTARARRILEEGRRLLRQLRTLGEQLTSSTDSAADGAAMLGEPPNGDGQDPLARRYQDTVAMTTTALRMLQAFPDAPSAQLALCRGLESILDVVKERVASITVVFEQRRQETAQVVHVARLLAALHAKEPVTIQSFADVAEHLLTEVQQGKALRFLSAPPDQPAHFVASHALTVAQVIARVVRQDPDFRSDPLGPVLAALLFDAGMLAIPVSILAKPGPLEDEQRRILEAHTRLGAELMTHLLPSGSWLAEVAAGHHERLDGTGYPGGRQETQLNPLTRLIAVCDVYAALCTARPHRLAFDTRTALTDTLLLADQGALDRFHAERLLRLSFYPVGSVVELADGAFGVVVATHMGRRDLTASTRARHAFS